MSLTKNHFLFVCLLGLFSLTAHAQEVKIELGENEVALNETFTIKVIVSGDKIRSYDQLPEVPGFQKQGISQSSSMNIVNGQMSSTNSIIQYYKPLRKGQFSLPGFKIDVNGITASSSGTSITVVDARSSGQGNRALDPFDDLFGGNNSGTPEYVEVEDDAFFSLSVSKDEVYVGEGFSVSFAFFMSESNQAPFNFHEPGKQLERIINEIKPGNAWEENFNITSIQPERVEFGGKKWTKYKVYEANFYPFNAGTVDIPSVGWEMIKYKVAKNPSFFGSNRLQDFKTFYSLPKVINVKELPPHPLKNEVSVGNYRLRENFSDLEVQTGEGFTYDFIITGEGNISSISPPKVNKGQKLNTFDPNEQVQINRGRGKVTGMKEYSYFMTLNEPETVPLKDHFEWVFFNPDLAKYDTLVPQAVVRVSGESRINQAISSSRLGGLYDLIEVEDNKLLNQGYKSYFSGLINILLLLALILLAYLIVKKK